MTISNSTFAQFGVLFAGFSAGFSGFGFNLISVPLLLLVYDPRNVVIVSLLLGLVASGGLLLTPGVYRHISLKLTAILFVFSLLGLPLGMWIFVGISTTALKLIIAIITIGYAILVLYSRNFQFKLHQFFAIPAAILSGLLAASTGFSGPPVVLFLHSQQIKPEAFRATVGAYIFLVTLATIAQFWFVGLIDAALFRQSMWLVPATLGGLIFGLVLFTRVSSATFNRLVLVGLAVIGLWNLISLLY